MNIANLNLARKWRSKNFDQVIGQDLSIKMLKNSLYLDHVFPVYLFAGQRGCGKTSTARIFAAALNCELLTEFQKNPKKAVVPCLACGSCNAMMEGKHPDFFEIDAASHTGVDTIRTIIDASQLLPIMGTKKIYLIDEAHMLSKASFNALLKILEEPPRSVLFILATTDEQKIIETVRSRCFQLFFKPIESPALYNHLMNVCQAEKIVTDQDGLDLIIQESQGSARDAINLLEQVRFSHGRVTKDAVLQVLGHLDDGKIIELFEIIIYKQPSHLLTFLQTNRIDTFATEFIWKRCIDFIRAMLWQKHGVKSTMFVNQSTHVQRLAHACTWTLLHEILDHFYTNELVFFKTTAKYALLEMILLQLCQKNKTNNDATGTPTVSPLASSVQHNEGEDDEVEIEEDDELEDDALQAAWKRFLQSIHTLQDPLLLSIFRQGTIVTYDPAKLTLILSFSKEQEFFNNLLDDSRAQWLPLLRSSFGAEVTLQPLFEGVKSSVVQEKASIVSNINNDLRAQPAVSKVTKSPYKPMSQKSQQSSYRAQGAPALRELPLDVSDKSLWPKTQLLMHYFPGTVTQVKEINHEAH